MGEFYKDRYDVVEDRRVYLTYYGSVRIRLSRADEDELELGEDDIRRLYALLPLPTGEPPKGPT